MKKIYSKKPIGLKIGYMGWLSGVRLIFVLFFWGSLSLDAHAQQTPNATFSSRQLTVEQVLSQITKQLGYDIYYSNDNLNVKRSVTLPSLTMSVEDALKAILGRSHSYKINGKAITISPVTARPQAPFPAKSDPQHVTITGVVVDVNDKPIAGATIYVDPTTGVGTDSNGAFELKVRIGSKLTVSFVGYAQKSIEVKAARHLVIVLEEEVQSVEDVVVTGYYTRRKDSYTGAASTVTGDQIRQVSGQNILNTLAMIDPSFEFIENLETGSDPNALPIFQIRGSTNLESDYKNNPNMPTFILDGFEVTAQKIFDLDPNKIAGITILKDAAATAIYGSRASNGVVVVETTTPKEGQLTLTYTGGFDFEIADLRSYNLMNSAEKLEYELRAGLYTGNYLMDNDKLQDRYNAKLAQIKAGVDTDWCSMPVKDVGFGHKHSVMVEGGDRSFRYGIGVNASNKSGVMKGSGRDKYGIEIKLQYVRNNLRFINYLTFDNVGERNSTYGNFSDYAYANPYFYPYDKNGNIVRLMGSVLDHPLNLGGQVVSLYSDMSEANPLFNSTLGGRNSSKYNNFINNFSIEWTIVDQLRLKTQLSLNNRDFESDLYLPSGHTSFNDKEIKGSYRKGITKDFSYDANVMMSYFGNIRKHSLNIAAIYNIKQTKTDGFYVTSVNFPNARMDHIGMGAAYPEGGRPTGIYEMTRLMGVVANLNYSYDNRFLFDASIRSDASSLFGANQRWGTFGSLGAGWNLHNETFMKDAGLITMLKLRASWGLTGGTNFYPFQAMSIYEYDQAKIDGISYGGAMGALVKAYGNRNLKWQRTEKQNIGLDFELFRKRLSGYVNVYSDISKDVLIDVSLAPSLGFGSYKENLGKVKNSGWEVRLMGSVINNPGSRLKADIFFNAVRNVNKLIEINNALIAFNNRQDENTGLTKPVVRYLEGCSINTIWANESLGIDPSSGNEVFVDRDGEKTFAWSVRNYKPMGNTDAKIRGNFGTNVMYRGFTLSVYFLYSYGGDIYNQTLVDKVENVDPKRNADKRVLYDRWKTPGDITEFKSISDKSTTMPTSRFIEANNYMQSSSMNLTYDLNKRWIEKAGFEKIRISLISNNLIRWSTVKMERGINYPFARTFTAAIQITL